MNTRTRMSVGIGVVALGMVALPVSPASAQSVSARAGANATVNPAGPRTGGNGINFFNVEGSGNGSFSSYGVLDFTAASFGITGTVNNVTNLNLLLRDAPAGFSSAGPVNINFYLATDNTTSISNATPQGSASPLRFQGTGEGIDPTAAGQLGVLYKLGAGTYSKSTTGTAFNYALAFNGTVDKNLFINNLNSNQNIRLVVTPGQNDAAATFGGASSTTASLADAPSLSFIATTNTTTAPEAGTLVLLLAGVPAAYLGWTRRRK